MNTAYASFAEFLKAKREERDVTLRELARKMGVSAAFISDVENGRGSPLKAERLEQVATILNLTNEERSFMYDLAGKQRNAVAPDLPMYIMGKEYVCTALRTARDLNADEADWQKFVDDLKTRKG